MRVPRHPGFFEVRQGFLVFRRKRVAWWKWRDVGADAFNRLHFRSDPCVACFVSAEVQGDDAYWVASNQPTASGWLVDDERVHALQVVHQRRAMRFVQPKDDFAIRPRLKWVALQHILLEDAVVVDFSVDRKERPRGGIGKGLRTAGHVHNGETLVGNDGRGALGHARPIGPTMMLAGGGAKDSIPVLLGGLSCPKKGRDGAHGSWIERTGGHCHLVS